MDAKKSVTVEIHLLMLDCQGCGSEINPDREEYIGQTRMCPRCYEQLKKTNRKRRK